MAKNSKPSHTPDEGDDEYKFSEEHALVEPMDEKPKRAYFTFLKNKRFIAIIIILIAIFVVYQYLNITTKSKRDLGELASQTPLGESATPAGGIQNLPATTTTTTTVQTHPALASLGSQESTPTGTLSQDIQQNQMQIQQLQQSIQQLQMTISQLSGQMITMSNRVNSAPQSCKAPSIVLKEQADKSLASTAQSIPPAPKPPVYPVYTVRAIVPGRAWLQVKRNSHVVKLVSVKVGDNLPGYGRIQAMNSYQGKVWTSSGKIIVLNYDEDTAIQI